MGSAMSELKKLSLSPSADSASVVRTKMATVTNLLSNWFLHCAANNANIKTKIKIAPKLPSNSLQLQALCLRRPSRLSSKKTRAAPTASMAATGGAEEFLPPVLDSSSDPPPLFDGTTRLYTSYICPYAQRVWIARNYKGLQEKIKLVPIDLENRPAWYKEKVYAPNKVPLLEHNNEVRGESIDLIKYIDNYFEGPALYPDDPSKIEFAEELLSYSDTFIREVLFSLKGESENEISTAFDYLETALFKFIDGPFFLGQFSVVDIAYAPFIERFHPLLLDVKKYDITRGRPMLTSWIEEMNRIEAYKHTKRDIRELIAALKNRFSIN